MQYLIATVKSISIPKLVDPTYREQVKRSWDIRIANNAVKYNDAVKWWITMCDSAVAIYGRNSNVHKYILSHKVPKPPNITAEWDKLMKMFNTWQKKEAKRIEKERLIAAARAKSKEAYDRRKQKIATSVEVLEGQGYKLNEDFGKHNAISFKKKVLIELPTGTLVKRAWPELIKLEGGSE